MRAKRFIYYLQFLLQSCCRFSERTHFIWANGLSPKPICAVNLGVLSQNLASRGTQSRSIAGITAFAGKVDGKEYSDGGDNVPLKLQYSVKEVVVAWTLYIGIRSALQNKGTYGRAASGFCSSSLRRRVGRAVMISSHDKPSHEYNRTTSR